MIETILSNLSGLSGELAKRQPELCERPLCWETYVGQQFYKLTVFDLLTQGRHIPTIYSS
jgi:hypothetical protein